MGLGLAPNPRVIFDSELNFRAHVGIVTKFVLYHLKNIAKLQPFLSLLRTERLIHTLISSRLDYCNALAGPLKNPINQLQLCPSPDLDQKKRTHYISYEVTTLVSCQLSY